MTKIIMQIENKKAMLDTLQVALTEGEKFAKAMFDALIEVWGADKNQIDEVGLIKVATEHFISCCMKDVGLSKCGLTRAQYEAVEK